MTLPPLVVSGQVISAAHINAIRNALGTSNAETYSWTAHVSANGKNITGLGTVTAVSAVVSGTLVAGTLEAATVSASNVAATGTVAAANANITGTVSANAITAAAGITAVAGTFTGALSAQSLTVSAAITGSTATFSGAVSAASLTIPNVLSAAAGTGLILRPTGGGEGGQLDLMDATGSAAWSVDNAGQNIRIFRGSTVGMQIDAGGTVRLGADRLRLLPAGGLVVPCPVATAPDADHLNNSVTFSIDEVNHRLFFRVKESTGAFKQGYVQLV